ncbi:MAG: sensor histidine kinase [Alphaproteobacteria bacterium]
MPDILSKNENRRYVKSSSFIMALLFTILCGLAALSFGYFITYFTKGHFVHSTRAVLDAEYRYIQSVGLENLPENDQLYIPLDEDGSLPDYIPDNISPLVEGIIVFEHPPDNKKYAAKIFTSDNDQKILIGTDIDEISEQFRFMQWLGIASIIFVMIVVFVSYLISIFVVKGTNNIADTARDIMQTGDLSRRLSIHHRWDDLSNMAYTLNMLLDRIEELMQGVRQVSDNIAHDLRTPLTRLRGQIETLKDGPDKEKILEEADHLLNTFNALLRISRIEAEKQKSQFKDLDLKALLSDVLEFYAPLMEDKNITHHADLCDFSLSGDKDLLFQAYANLLDNAVKFTPAEGHISLEMRARNKHIEISVTNSGEGIKDGEEQKIFNRFYRSDQSRNSAGTGLGLSLVQAAIELHGGRVRADNIENGFRIITIL